MTAAGQSAMITPASTRCPLCAGRLERWAEGVVLGNRAVNYQRCDTCRSVFLISPDWLDEAYSRAISALDVGLLERCLQLANITEAVLTTQRLRAGRYLDFAGGYGTLTRLMRDRGLDFRHHDPMCENVFAQGFTGELDERYDLITAFEVLEHLTAPADTLALVAQATDLLLATTQVIAEPAPPPGSWDYYAEDTGQHVTFYTVDGLHALGERLGYQVTSNGRLVHLFHRGSLRATTRAMLRDERLAYAVGAVRSEMSRRRGLTLADHDAIVGRIRKSRPAPGAQ